MLQTWLHGFPLVGLTAPLATRAEQQGFEGLLLADSQILVGDPFVELALAARATTHLRLGVAVTNPITRHPSVTASSIVTVHAESDGRAVLGFARVDSALKQIGEAPASLGRFESALHDLRAYLGLSDVSAGGADPVTATAPLAWLPSDLAPISIDVAATGPKVIELGATIADRLTFARPHR